MNRILSGDWRNAEKNLPVLLCFSHLRWDFVFQRPQHLMTRAARTHKVFYVEEPVQAEGKPHFRMQWQPSGVTVLTPVVTPDGDTVREQRELLAGLAQSLRPADFVQWFYTPMAQQIAADLPSNVIVYDCMDELSAFRFAPADLVEMEQKLLGRSDLVFTGGASLFAAKAGMHRDVSCFPSSVDVDHFSKARGIIAEPADQAGIAQPRIGYFGVIDERMDLGLVARAAAELPDVQFVMLGPVVKVDPADLPVAPNLHWLGLKDYDDLPSYMGGWNAAWMPFALNAATRFISPTKTPEFLAAGLPVTSTAVPDVVADWGNGGLVRIADAATIAEALRASLGCPGPDWSNRVEARLASLSWDRTWAAMRQKIEAAQRFQVVS